MHIMVPSQVAGELGVFCDGFLKKSDTLQTPMSFLTTVGVIHAPGVEGFDKKCYLGGGSERAVGPSNQCDSYMGSWDHKHRAKDNAHLAKASVRLFCKCVKPPAISATCTNSDFPYLHPKHGGICLRSITTPATSNKDWCALDVDAAKKYQTTKVS